MPEADLGRERSEGIGPDVTREAVRGRGNVGGVAFRSTLDPKGTLLVCLTGRRAGHLSDKNFADSNLSDATALPKCSLSFLEGPRGLHLNPRGVREDALGTLERVSWVSAEQTR